MTFNINNALAFAPTFLPAATKNTASQVPVEPDAANAAKAANLLAQAPRLLRAGNSAPELQVPERNALNAAEAQTLMLPNDRSGNDELAVGAALASLMQAALRTLDAPTQVLITQSGGTVPRELLASAPFVAVKEALETLTGLVSANGAIVQPTVRDLAALSGTGPISTPQQGALRSLLQDAPEVQQAIDELATLDKDELPLRLKTDPRLSYVLLLVSMLMALAATQREQAASMLQFAEKSIQDMGVKMVDSAKQQQLAKIVALAVVVVVSVAAVGVGANMASRNVTSLRGDHAKANQLTAKAASLESQLAKGANTTRVNGGAMDRNMRNTLREEININRSQAAELNASHSVNMTHNAVGTQGSQALGQASHSAGQLAGSGHEIEAAQLNAQLEKRRNDASTEQQVNQSGGQTASKLDDSGAALFRQQQQAEQDRADTRNDVVRRLR